MSNVFPIRPADDDPAEQATFAAELLSLGEDVARELAAMRREARLMSSTSRTALLPTFKASDLHGKPVPERQWLVEDLIPQGVPTILSGDGGTGKSLTALQLAVAVAIHGDWFGRETKGGRCLFVTAEDDVDETHRRLHAICYAEGILLADLDNLEVCSLAGMDAVMGLADNRSNKVSETDLFNELQRKVEEAEPILVVLDTLADLFSGDENNRMQARQFVGILRRLKTTVLLLSHPSVAGMLSGTGTSGSTAWNNSVRSRLYLSYPKTDAGEDQDSDARVLSNKKQNYGRKGEEINLRWEDGRFIAEEPPEKPMPNDIDEMVFVLFSKAVKLGKTTTRTLIGATLSEVEGAKLIDGDKRRRKTKINSAVDRLVESGRLKIVQKGGSNREVNHVALP